MTNNTTNWVSLKEWLSKKMGPSNKQPIKKQRSPSKPTSQQAQETLPARPKKDAPLLYIPAAEWDKAETFFNKPENKDEKKFENKNKTNNTTHSFIKDDQGVIWAMASIKNKKEKKQAELGQGTFGLVKVDQNRQGQNVAIKIQKYSDRNKQKLANEIAMTVKADPGYHKGEVVRDRQGHLDKKRKIREDKHYTVTELLPGTELFERVYDKNGAINSKAFTEKQKLMIALQCAEALQEIHNKGIIHADIKPENIMIHIEKNGEIKIKIIDYGEAMNLNGKEKLSFVSNSPKGSPVYMAPEVATQEEIDDYFDNKIPFEMIKRDYSPASDTYSLAVLFEDDLQLKNIPKEMFKEDPSKRKKLPEVIEHLKKELNKLEQQEKSKNNILHLMEPKRNSKPTTVSESSKINTKPKQP